MQSQNVPRTNGLFQSPRCLHTTRYRVCHIQTLQVQCQSHEYAPQSHATCHTIHQIHPQLVLHCLQTFNNSPDYRHYRLFRHGFHQRQRRHKVLYQLRVYCQRRRYNLVNPQIAHCRILHYGIKIHGTFGLGARGNRAKTTLPRTTNPFRNLSCSSPYRQSNGARHL